MITSLGFGVKKEQDICRISLRWPGEHACDCVRVSYHTVSPTALNITAVKTFSVRVENRHERHRTTEMRGTEMGCICAYLSERVRLGQPDSAAPALCRK